MEKSAVLENANYINNITDNLFSYRWLVEEYRVSLFAQSLGCSQKVSPKILDKYWNNFYQNCLDRHDPFEKYINDIYKKEIFTEHKRRHCPYTVSIFY